MCHRSAIDIQNSRCYGFLDFPRFMIKHSDGGVILDQSTRMSNIDRSLTLITSEHPHLDLCAAKLINSFRNATLQLVFDSCGPRKLESLLNEITCLFDAFLAVDETGCRIQVALLPRCIFVL